jgi:hypothetical protein
VDRKLTPKVCEARHGVFGNGAIKIVRCVRKVTESGHHEGPHHSYDSRGVRTSWNNDNSLPAKGDC